MAKDPKKLMEVARKAAGVSVEEADKAKKGLKDDKKPKPIPNANAKKWLNNVKRSKKLAKPIKDDSERYIRMYQGDYSRKPNKRVNHDTMSVNIVYSHIEIITPAVFSGPPVIKVRPKPKVGESAKEAAVRARNMELVINYWFKELGADAEFKDAFLDSFFSHTAIELGWETEVIEKEEIPTPGEQQTTMSPGEPSGPISNMVTVKDQPFLKRRDPWEVGFDPDATTRRASGFYFAEDVMRYNDFIADPRFTDACKKKIKPQLYPQDSQDAENNNTGAAKQDDKSDKEWVKLTTIWDKTSMRKMVVSEGYERFCNTDDPLGEEWPYEIEYKNDVYPICIHDAKRDRRSPYSWSEFKAYEAQIVELNRIRSAIQVHVRRSLPKYIYTQSFGSRDKVSKLLNSRSDEATQVDNLEAMRPLENAEVPKDLWQFNKMSQDDLLNISGQFEYQNNSIADTATEASLIEGRSQVRKNQRSRQWEQYVVEVGAKLGMLCQQNMDTAIAVEIAGEQGIEWLNVSKKDIEGEFYFDIEPGIMEYKNEALRKQQLLKFYEISQNNPNVDQRYLIAEMADEFDLNPEDIIIPEDKMPQPEPPEPTIKFKDIDAEILTNPLLMNAIVVEAMKQNNVPVPPALESLVVTGKPIDAHGGEVPQGGGPIPDGASVPGAAPESLPGKGAGLEAMSPNGNPNLPPAIGNLRDQSSGGML